MKDVPILSDDIVDNADSTPADDIDVNQDLVIDEEVAESSPSEEASEPDSIEDDGTPRFQQRIDKVTGQRKEAEASAEALRLENEGLRNRMSALENRSPTAYTDPGEPTLDQFDGDFDQHQSAVIDYRAEKIVHDVLANQQVAQNTARSEAEYSQLMSSHNNKRQTLYSQEKDALATLNQTFLNDGSVGGNAAGQALLRLSNGADVEYHIAKNPQLAARLNMMDSPSAMMEVSRLSEQLVAKPKKKAALPEPVNAEPTGGGKSTTDGYKYISDATFS